MVKKIGIVVCLLMLAAGLSCKKSPTNSGNEEELITTFIITLNEQELITTLTTTLGEDGGSGTPVVQFRDLDGPGGNAATLDTLTVATGRTYDGEIQLLDESKTPVEDITEEVEDEAEAHQFFFVKGGNLSAGALTITDKESDYGTQTGTDHPVGVRFRLVVANNTGNGTLRVSLSHYPSGGKNGSAPGSETDIDVTFPVKIE